MNIHKLKSFYELEAGEIEWERELAQTAFGGFPEFITQSGRDLAARYNACSERFGEIFDLVGFTARDYQRAANPITLDLNSKKALTANLTANQYDEFGYKVVTTEVKLVDASTKAELEGKVYKPGYLVEKFTPASFHYKARERDFNFLAEGYEWVNRDEVPKMSVRRFVDLRRAILPVILQATETQDTLFVAINNPTLNPEIYDQASALQQA